MELKLLSVSQKQHTVFTFNRTAYGIEILGKYKDGVMEKLLIAPLMELKFYKINAKQRIGLTFNRTAYGIEIRADNSTG